MQQIVSRTRLVYGSLAAVFCIIIVWQTAEHLRVRQAAKAALINRSRDVASTLGLVIRSTRFRGPFVSQERLESALKEMVKSGEFSSVALLNAAGDIVISAGPLGDIIERKSILQSGEHLEDNRVTVINLVDLGASVSREGETNSRTIVLPPRPEGPPGPRFAPPWSNDAEATNRAGSTNSDSLVGRPAETNTAAVATNLATAASSRTNVGTEIGTNLTNFAAAAPGGTNRFRRPPRMSEEQFKALQETRGLHGLAVTMSIDTFKRTCSQDLWMRLIIGCFAGVSVVGLALAWRNLGRSSELEMRLLRASELNSHLKQMNLAAAGLAHETRNPLNIIRGLAQMISKQQEASGEIRGKSLEIVEEADRVTGQLNEFINFSRPREVRRSAVALQSVIQEVTRALTYDIEEKGVQLQVLGDQLTVEADEQLLRQTLFNLLLNAIQAVDPKGEIQVAAGRRGPAEAFLEIRDTGPGVPLSQRSEIFKPYFTTFEKGTGLGLAVVQQNVLAHGWDIECLSNDPKGAVFRITHLKIVAKV